ncbi:lipoprotein [Flammeovirga sp. MY04]|uniref:HmuY family protein n=1 Tax=Flammeovirga sp. MY04 TaxID=1191459 RepID=UPI000806295E|nr:HmuY family protein [Flammeovirga sp. MY04]ANQ51191.1 lipoprotein [Flammeovirga sp. MY04]
MKKFITFLSAIAILSSCNSDDHTEAIVPEDTSSHDLQVSLYGMPVVEIEKEQYPGGPVVTTELDYNRQVYINLDAASADANADTTGVHWNDVEYYTFDIPEENTTGAGPEGWDIVMTYYHGITYDDQGTATPYYMTGGLINTSNVKAIRLNKEEIEGEGQTFVSYDDITFEEASAITLSSDAASIGSDWKALDFATFTYKIVEDQYYIIESSDKKLYKLVFTDFYDLDSGTKGFPMFKFQRIIAE